MIKGARHSFDILTQFESEVQHNFNTTIILHYRSIEGILPGPARLEAVQTEVEMKTLFESVRVGRWTLPNRIVMAPLTRTRAHDERTPNDLMLEYYVQRASAGLILTEATAISPMAVGYPSTPGIWTERQVEGWKKITDAVHKEGGHIVLQLWHVGRVSHSHYLGGALPVAPSEVPIQGHVSLLRPQQPYQTPKALTIPEIKATVADYRKAAENALRAGFDGVEIHGANGYLPDQFLESKTNLRTDEYGGSVENRARFLLEVTDAAIDVWGADRVGVHLSPRGGASDIDDANPRETFGYVARELGKRKIAFIFMRENQSEGYLTPYLKREFGGTVIANENLDIGKATELVNGGVADLVSFGRLYIANPDLVDRLKKDAPLNSPDPSTFYGPDAKGYTDYPRLS